MCASESVDICFFSPSLLYSHAHTTTWFWAIRFLSSPWLEYSPVRHGSGSRLLHHSPQNFSRRETWFVWSCLLLDDDARFLIIFIRCDMEKEALWQMVVVLHLFWLSKRILFFTSMSISILFVIQGPVSRSRPIPTSAAGAVVASITSNSVKIERRRRQF